MTKIIPTVLAYDMESFESLWDKVVPIADEIQVDVMDGRFVETKSVSIDDLPDVSDKETKFEVHLMIKEPMSWILPLADKGYYRMIIHYESIMPEDVPLINDFMKKQNLEWCLAINPDTTIDEILPLADQLTSVLIMGVHPGRNHAPYVQNTPERVAELHEKAPHLEIQIDGGMTDETIGAVVAAGATRVNTGSFVGGSDDPKASLEKMQQAAGVNG